MSTKNNTGGWVKPALAVGLAFGATALFFSTKPAAQKPAEARPAAAMHGTKIEAVTAKPAEANPAPATAAAVTTPAPAKAEEKIGEYTLVGFDRLASFTYDVPEETATNKPAVPLPDQIPAGVKSYDKKLVALKGFMLPLKVEGGLITELLIMRDQSMCCYGAVPRINEWVSVKMTNKGVKPVMDQAITLYGRLHVGEIRENGYLVGIYALDGEKMAGPADL